MQQNLPSSSIEQRLYPAASRRTKANGQEDNIRLKEEKKGNKRCLRNRWKYVQKCQQSQGVEDARRQLCQVITIEISESSKNWNRSNVQGWLNLMPHCPPPLLELWLERSALESGMVKLNKQKEAEFIHRASALSSRISLSWDEGKRQAETGEGWEKQMVTIYIYIYGISRLVESQQMDYSSRLDHDFHRRHGPRAHSFGNLR